MNQDKNYDKIKQALAENITTSTITKLAEHGIDKGDMQLILSLYSCQQLEKINRGLLTIAHETSLQNFGNSGPLNNPRGPNDLPWGNI